MDKKSNDHLIFDVNMDFIRKAIWVKDGPFNPVPDTLSHTGVVSCESIRIALMTADLQVLHLLESYTRKEYFQAPSSEKHFIICVLEFGLELQLKLAMVVRELYGGGSCGL